MSREETSTDSLRADSTHLLQRANKWLIATSTNLITGAEVSACPIVLAKKRPIGAYQALARFVQLAARDEYIDFPSKFLLISESEECLNS